MLAGDDVTLGEIARSLQRMELRLDTVTGDHEQRLRDLEKWKYALPFSTITALGAVIAALIQ